LLIFGWYSIFLGKELCYLKNAYLNCTLTTTGLYLFYFFTRVSFPASLKGQSDPVDSVVRSKKKKESKEPSADT
jgi:hypothetical protein